MKKTNLTINQIDLEQIDFKNKTYDLRPKGDEPPNEFFENIKSNGILHPPIIHREKDGSYIIIAGRRRLDAVQNLGLKRCYCLIMPKTADELRCMNMLLEDGLLGAPWSPIVKAKYLHRIVTLLGKEETVRQILPRLGVTPQSYQLDNLLALLKLEEPLALAVHNGQITEKAAYELSHLPFRDRLALFDVIINLQLSVGNQRKLIAICNELAHRASSSIHAILTTPEILDVISQQDGNTPQQTTKLMKTLHLRQFPRLSAAEQEFAHLQTNLGLPPWAQLSHASSFENDKVSLHLTFTNQEKLICFCKSFVTTQ